MTLKKTLFYLVTGGVFVFPLFLLLLQSLSAPFRFHTGNGITLQWTSYQRLWNDPYLIEATGTSVLIAFSVLILNFLIALPAGKALATTTFRGKAILEAFLLAPLLIPVLAITMGLHLWMIRIGLADTAAGVILIHLIPTVPYSIKIFHNTYKQIGSSMLQQPEVLGAGKLQQLFTIELPLMKPAIRSTTFLTIVISLSQYAITSIIGGGQVRTLPMVFFPFMENADPSLMSAFSIWFALVPLAMYAIVEGMISFLPYTHTRWRNQR
ncbi:ABC transporter permease subunit [Halobacillus sp. BAB-2008]|uniref:ABC transporter permease n=1 Tax=Halobacillus sp. BAB-2008 TaxID=1246484 RepID=UPI0002A4DDBC|nr:ABC transporter permease subunit [Halobacillus sp. BAB-2008]ELK48699.1 ABC-type transport system permease [Halobacillus sp. BAB-2008]